MTFAKPKGVYVTVRDGASGESKTLTVYGSKQSDVIETIKRAVGAPETAPDQGNGGATEDVTNGKVPISKSQPQPPVGQTLAATPAQ